MTQPAANEQNLCIDSPALRPYPSKLFVELTTDCNLGCAMCVKQTADCAIHEGQMATETFQALEPALQNAEALILNGVGESLLHPQLEEFIETARVLMPAQSWIGFQTNGLLLTDEKARALLEAGLDRICVSVDTVAPEKLRQLRQGVELGNLENAFEALAKAKFSSARPEVQIGVEIVIMRHNLAELPDTIRWAATRGVSFVLVSHILPYAEEHAENAIYEACSSAAITLYQQWKARAKCDSVEIDQYPKVLWNYHKTPEDLRIIGYVEDMKADAEQQNIFLDLKKLFGLNATQLDEVAETFAEAEMVAQENGLELRLPELALKENRLCDFIEDGSAFVSWQGDVHPCYFLWHSYRCYASGWDQQIKPKVFGRANEQDILDIWNSAEFRTFRKNVIAYDYPYCSSCGLAPCDYVQTEDFQQDCHINSEPCGSCLWCMGLFHCLR